MLTKIPASGGGTNGAAAPRELGFLWFLGFAAILVAIGVSGALVQQHLGGWELPGCGRAKACDELSSGKWGKVAGIPVASWGVAYFTAMGLAWMVTLMHGLTSQLRWVVRLGMLGSLCYLGIMYWEQKLCPYCVAVHISNAILLLATELRRVEPWNDERLQLASLAFSFCLLGSVGWGLEWVKATAQQQLVADTNDASLDALGEAVQSQSQQADGDSGRPANLGPATGSTSAADSRAKPDGETPAPSAAETAVRDPFAEDSQPLQPASGSASQGPLSATSVAVEVDAASNELTPTGSSQAGPDAVAADFSEGPEASAPPVAVDGGVRPTDVEPVAPLPQMEVSGETGTTAGEIEAPATGQATTVPENEPVQELASDMVNEVTQGGEPAVEPAAAQVGESESANPSAVNTGQAANAVTDASASTQEEPPTQAAEKNDAPPQPFEGKFVFGPRKALMRIVIFSDYQCPACQRFDPIAMRFAKRHPNEVSLSVKHLPMCMDCNDYIPFTRHENACLGAQGAEAAGILAGADGFWKAHEWLLAQEGVISETKLKTMAKRLQLGDAETFLKVARGEQALRQVRADVDEAAHLGMVNLPMVFVNGIEFPGWTEGEAILEKALERIQAAGGKPAYSTVDRPVSGEDKYFKVFTTGKAVRTAEFPWGTARWKLGPEKPKVKVVYLADHQSLHAKPVLKAVMGVLEAYPQDVGVAFFHYPLSKAENPAVVLQFERFPHDWTMALAAESVGRIKGNAAFWKMHQWLVERQAKFEPKLLNAACAEFSIEPRQLLEELKKSATAADVKRDLIPAKQADIKFGPVVFVNGKELEGLALAPGLLERAVKHAGAQQ